MGGATLAHYLLVSAHVRDRADRVPDPAEPDRDVPVHGVDVPGGGLALIAFSRFHLEHSGQTFVIFVLTVAAAEAAMALALVVLLFRKRESLDADEWTEMKG
jgi:hypothetical protein